MAYTLTLTSADRHTIGFVGYRYAWSDALERLPGLSQWDGDIDADEPITFHIPEYAAWMLRDAFEADTEGGHSYFPMLDHRSALADKLFVFLDSIV